MILPVICPYETDTMLAARGSAARKFPVLKYMKIILVNLDYYRYDIQALVKAFYPEDEVKVFLEGDRKYENFRKHAGEDRGMEHPEIADDAMHSGNEGAKMSLVPFLVVTYLPDRFTLRFGDETDAAEHEGLPAGTTGSSPEADPTSVALVTVSGTDPETLPFNAKSTALCNTLKRALYDALAARTGRKLPWGMLIGVRPTKIPMADLECGFSERQAAERMTARYAVSEEKAALAAGIAVRERELLSRLHVTNGYSLYVGIPFCPTTCLYCSFPSNALGLWKDRVDEYLDALIREMRAAADLMRGKTLDTVYIGGGTPTSLTPAQSDRLLSAIQEYFPAAARENIRHAEMQPGQGYFSTSDQTTGTPVTGAPDSTDAGILEFTVEAGRPDSITADKLRVLREHGVTRISVNPQTMNDRTLGLIGRRHTAAEAEQAFQLARDAGFDNINMDIILGLPEETDADVQNTIDRIRKLSPDALTVHSLAVKRASRMQEYIEENGYTAIRNNKETTMEIAARGASDMGLLPYYLYRQKNQSGNFENVGYARPGCYGIYNILIMEEVESIVALGAGSVSKRVGGIPRSGRMLRCDNPKDIDTYITHIDELMERKNKLFG